VVIRLVAQSDFLLLDFSPEFSVDMKAGVGMVPWNAAATYLTGDRGFCVQNVFLNAGKSWTIKGTDSMSVGVFTNLIWNPALDDVNFVGGISFRM